MATIPAALNDQQAAQVGKLLHALVTKEDAETTVTLADLQSLVVTGAGSQGLASLSAGSMHALALSAVGGQPWGSAGQALSTDPDEWTEEQYLAAGL